MYKIKNQKKSKKLLWVILLLAVAVLSTLVVLEKTGKTNFYEQSSPATPIVVDDEPTVNLEPPTRQEAELGDTIKQEVIEQESVAIPNNAQIIITDAAQYDSEVEVRAFVSNVIKDGTCTITFTKNTLTLTKQVPANSDASTTPCFTLTLDTSEFTESGTWNVEVTYENETITGTASTSLEITL